VADVALVRELYGLVRKGDPRELPAYFHEDATWEPVAKTQRRPAEGGHELARRLLYRGTVHKLTISEPIDLGEHVLVTVSGRKMHFMGASFFSRSIYQLVTTREGRVEALRDFRTREEALAAAGIAR
jgi:ketosteroid isomerase-like protein